MSLRSSDNPVVDALMSNEQSRRVLCVPAAFRSLGLPVENIDIIQAAISKRGIDVYALANKLGLKRIENTYKIHELLKEYKELITQGKYIFLQLGLPVGEGKFGVLAVHLNAVLGILDNGNISLGGISISGDPKHLIISPEVLEKMMPKEDGILIFEKDN